MILDINDCKNYDQILDAMDIAEATYGERPQKLIVKRRVFGEVRKSSSDAGLRPQGSLGIIEYDILWTPIIFDGAVIIYQEDIDGWKWWRDKADPLEFWIDYWMSGDKLLFDPFEPIVAIKANPGNHNSPPSPDYLGG